MRSVDSSRFANHFERVLVFLIARKTVHFQKLRHKCSRFLTGAKIDMVELRNSGYLEGFARLAM